MSFPQVPNNPAMLISGVEKVKLEKPLLPMRQARGKESSSVRIGCRTGPALANGSSSAATTQGATAALAKRPATP